MSIYEENLAAFPAHLGREFSSLVANGSGSVGEEKPRLCNNCFPTCRQIKPNRTIGSLATHHLFASHSPLVLEFLIQILSVSSFQPLKNSVKKDGVDFSFSGTDYKKRPDVRFRFPFSDEVLFFFTPET